MSRKTRNSQIKVEETGEDSPEEVDLDSEPEEIKGEIFKPTQSQSQCVMIAPDILCKNQSFSVVKLCNPQTLCGSLYAFAPKDSEVFEINQFTDEKRSWFLDNSVQSDGTLFLTTKVDPLFLILPCMVKAKHTSPLDQILIDEEYPETRRLESCLKKDSLENIADKKTAGSFEVWKFNENKTVEWLEKKVVKLSNHLREKKVNVQQSSISSNYVKSSNAEVPESSFLRYAHGMISEYLSEELSIVLEKHLKLPALARNSNEENKEPPAKRQKMNSEPLEDYSKDQSLNSASKDKVQVSAKSKALASAAKGSRNIASFFSKK